MSRTPIGRLHAVALTAAAMTAAAGCTSVGGGPPDQPAPATATVAFTTSFSASGAPKCTTGPIHWSAVPVSVSQGQGNASAVDETEPGHDIQPSGGRCGLSHRFTDLRPGRWRLSVVAGVASGTCDADLSPGLMFLKFEDGGCSARP